MPKHDFASRIVDDDRIFIDGKDHAKIALEYAEILNEMQYKDLEKKLVAMSREETEQFLNQARNT